MTPLLLLLLAFLSSASASLNGPVFQDIAILPSLSGLSPQLLSQSITVDPSATLFTFFFSLSNPDAYLTGALSVNLTRPSDGVVVQLSQNFSYAFPVPAATASFPVSVFLFQSPCTTAPYCNNTYLITATRSTFPTSFTNNYNTLIIVASVLGGVIILMPLMMWYAWKIMKKMQRVDGAESVSLTSGA